MYGDVSKYIGTQTDSVKGINRLLHIRNWGKTGDMIQRCGAAETGGVWPPVFIMCRSRLQ